MTQDFDLVTMCAEMAEEPGFLELLDETLSAVKSKYEYCGVAFYRLSYCKCWANRFFCDILPVDCMAVIWLFMTLKVKKARQLCLAIRVMRIVNSYRMTKAELSSALFALSIKRNMRENEKKC